MTKEQNYKRWLSWNGFSESGTIWIALGNTYPIKDELKAEGWRFNKEVGWHGANCIDISDYSLDGGEVILKNYSFDEVATVNEANGYCSWRADIKEILAADAPAKIVPETEWYGEKGDRVRDLEVIVSRVNSYVSRYGLSFIYTFVRDKNVFVWFTTKELEIGEGLPVILTGTIKDFSEYNGIKQTILTRCKVFE